MNAISLYYSRCAARLQGPQRPKYDHMHAWLFTGGTPEGRKKEVQNKINDGHIDAIDIVTVETAEPTIGIAQIRELQKRLFLAPYRSLYTVGILMEAQKLTIEAQNALLKTLEEPPPHVLLIVETANSHTLLPTILSRCQIIDLGSNEPTDTKHQENTAQLAAIAALSAGKKLQRAEELAKTRDEAKLWVERSLSSLRKTLLASYQQTKPDFAAPIAVATTIRLLLKAQAQLSANVTPKLVLDALFLSLPSLPQ